MSEPNGAAVEAEAREAQVNLRVSALERADLVKRAGEYQADTGKEMSLQEYIRSQLWPNGLPS